MRVLKNSPIDEVKMKPPSGGFSLAFDLEIDGSGFKPPFYH
jgi:hypothetical protein